jgi:murein L,D-transpeptidase YcbB/YkuD
VSRRLRAALALGALAGLAVGCDLRLPGSDRAIRQALRLEIAALPAPRGRHVRVESADLQPLVARFYASRGGRPAWATARGPEERAHAMLALLEDAPARGLDPRDYGVARIRHLLSATDPALHGRRPDPGALARLDLALTRAYLGIATHLLRGRANPHVFDPDWHHEPRSRDLVADLAGALERDDLGGSLAALEPSTPDYATLTRALGRYRALATAGGWPAVPDGPRLGPGARGTRVHLLRRRLAAEGDLDSAAVDGTAFDRALTDAVRRFQRRTGLDTTGVVGELDLAALNLPAAERVRQIALNLERRRWLTDSLGARVARVNIPEFMLRVDDEGGAAFESRVVVGTDSTRTPCFDAALKLMVVNPYWRIPPRIAASEILEQIRRDPEYLSRTSIRVMEGSGPTAREVDPATVRWSAMTARNFKYRLLQDPGPENAVGHVKFMCPNPYSIYLHDTPAAHLFRRVDRAFSHGCMRVERPLEFARYLLRGKAGWDSTRIATAFDSSRNEVVFLPEPMPVRVVYFTAWTDSAGRVQFRRDVYGLDSTLTLALQGLRPKPAAPVASAPGGPAAGPGGAPRVKRPDAATDSARRARSQAAAGRRDHTSRVAATVKPSER